MKHGYFKGISLVTLACVTASSAWADLTADQVWQNWQDVAASAGQAYTAGGETRSGDTLTLTDVGTSAASPRGGVTGTIPEIQFRENSDGTVEVTMSSNYTLAVEATTPEGMKTSNSFTVSQSGMKVVASGVPDSINYDVTADSVAIKAFDFVADDKPRDANIDIDITAIKAAYVVAQGDPTKVTTSFSASALGFHAVGEQEDTEGKFDVAGQMNDVTGGSTGTTVEMSGTEGLPAMLAAGFETKASLAYQSGSAKISTVDDAGTTVDMTSASQGGNIDVSIDRSSIAYGLGAKGVSVRAEGSGIPFPELTAAYDEAAFNVLLPVAKSDDGQDFKFLTSLRGLTVSDMLWSMIDPGATLPRTPATLVIDTSGKLKPLIDLASAGAMEDAMRSGPPAQIESLDINALQLTVGGAEFKGTGALTFDNSKPPMLGGVAPMPVGKLNLSLDGANGLIGKLQTLGLIPPDFVMGFGMIASMMARPGPGPDTLVSEIEFTGTGITANGMPLPFAP